MSLFTACTHTSTKQVIKLSAEPEFKIENDNAKICDTCETVIVAEHIESTGSSDLQNDSGIVYMPNKVILKVRHSVDSLRHIPNRDTMFSGPGSFLNSGDLKLAKRNNFYKLWPDTIQFKDYYKVYRLKGKITDCFVTDGNFVRLIFKMESYHELDTTYVKRMMEINYAKRHKEFLLTHKN
ncbi:hypothetical protein [Mucilaginibacter gracilis]|nr:hypothetical protein [Mucilaginibacter gracilis]